MKKLSIFFILLVAIFAINFAFAAAPDMSVQVSDINYGETAHVKIVLPSDAQGTVSVSLNGQSKVVNIQNGIATADFSGLSPGSYQVNVAYNGAGDYSGVSKSAGFNVIDKAPSSEQASGDPAEDTQSAPTDTGNATNSTNTTNTTNTTNDTNNTTPDTKKTSGETKNPTKQVNKEKPKQPPKKQPKSDLSKNPTGIPVFILVLVLIATVFGSSLRRK